MNLALWIVQGLLALLMTATGALKLVTPREKLAEKLAWARTFSDRNVKLLGVAEVLGAVGLVVPGLTGILPVLTPVAAVCLAILMGGAVKAHKDLGEPVAPAAIPGLLCLFVAVGRFALVPFV
jgi:hypothetical protein